MDNLFDKWIHGFHMPVFFIISGFFIRRNTDGFNVSTLIKKHFIKLLIPYLIFSFVGYITWMMLIHDDKWYVPLYYIFSFNSLDGFPVAGALWFLTAMFFSVLIYSVIINKLQSNFVIGLISCLFFILGCVLSSFYVLPLSLNASFVGIGFMWIGKTWQIYMNKNPKIFNLNIMFSLLGFFISSFTIMLNNIVNMRVGYYGNYLLFVIGAVGCSFFGFCICNFISQYNLLSIIKNYFAKVGKNSITYLCLNQVVILIITKLIDKFYQYTDSISMIITKILIMVMTLAVLYLIDILVRNSKFKFILGLS